MIKCDKMMIFIINNQSKKKKIKIKIFYILFDDKKKRTDFPVQDAPLKKINK
jgi:hypothetical protein